MRCGMTCPVCGGKLRSASAGRFQCVSCKAFFTLRFSMERIQDSQELEAASTMSEGDNDAYLADLKIRRSILLKTLDHTSRIFSRKRRCEIKVSLSLIQRQIDLREKKRH